MSETQQMNRRIGDRRKGRSLNEVEDELRTYVDEQVKDLRDHVDSAFPKKPGESDEEAVANHKRYHDGLIRSAEKWDKIWTDIFTTIAKGGLWSLVILIAAALWQAFVAEVKK